MTHPAVKKFIDEHFHFIFVGDKPVRNEATETPKPRSIHAIAQDIRANWTKPSAYAKPYLAAMSHLDTLDDAYYADSAESVVRYFLSNAMTWRGEHARRIKAELNSMLEARDVRR